MRRLFVIGCCLVSLLSKAQQNFAETTGNHKRVEVETEKIFVLSDKMAAFPGGPQAWEKFLKKNLDPSVPIRNNAPRGKYTVIIMFVVDQNGNVSEIKSLTNHGYGMEDEAVRLIEKAQRWSPAVQKGKPVKSFRKQPLTFNVR